MRRSVSFWPSLGSPGSVAGAELATNQRRRGSCVDLSAAPLTAQGYVSVDPVGATSVILEASAFPAGDTPDT